MCERSFELARLQALAAAVAISCSQLRPSGAWRAGLLAARLRLMVLAFSIRSPG